MDLTLKGRGCGISIIIPFRAPNPAGSARLRNLLWLVEYWRAQLPSAEVIVCDDPDADKVFSKSAAVNHGVERSTGDILAIIDADGLMPANSVIHCADEIRRARKRGYPLWFIPFRTFYRLTEEVTNRILESDVNDPYWLPESVDTGDYHNLTGVGIAHRFGALIQIVPREAFEITNGWEFRMRGWGGEDEAAMLAADALYGPHKTLPGRAIHLWHPMIGDEGIADFVSKNRRWEGQDKPKANGDLAKRYNLAARRPSLMRLLIEEKMAAVQ